MEFSVKQKEYIKNANHRWNFKSGATRSGKSYLDISFIVPYRIRERAGKKGLNAILGVSKGTIERNVLQPMREIYGTKLVGEINSQNICKIFGEEVYCLGAEKVNQVSKLRGSSIKYCYGDEVADWNNEVFELLKSRLDKEYSCFDGALNPQFPNHWLKKFLDGNADIYCQEYTIFDNPFLPKITVEELCKEYEGTVYYDRYILGKWVRAEGAIYQDFANNPQKYYREDVPPLMALHIGIDFGGNKSNHAFVATGITKDKQVIKLKSVSVPANGVSVDTLITHIQIFCDEIHAKYGTIHGVYCDSAEQTIINSIRSKIRYPVYNAIKMPINDRIRADLILMATGRYWLLKGQNDVLEKALSEAAWNEKEQNDVRLDNGTFNNDIIDASEYGEEYYIPILVRLK